MAEVLKPMTKNLTRRVQTLSTLAIVLVALLPTSISAHTGSGIAVDRLGQVYFLDTGSGLWRIDTKGTLTHLSRVLNHWLAVDEESGFASTTLPTGSLGEISKVGSRPTILLSSDYPIAMGQDGNLYYPFGRAGCLRIMRMLPSGATAVLATLPTTTSGHPLPHVNGLSGGPDGSLYYTEDSSIRRINAQGVVSTVATIPALAGGPSIPGTDIHPYLRGLVVDANGQIYVADNGDARVLKITPDGKITTLVQTQSPWSPTAVAVFGSDVYVLEFLHTARDVRRDWLPRVRKITSDGKSEIIMTVDRMPGAP
jgi:DNA-binding beta-propeller fold protein YncE